MGVSGQHHAPAALLPPGKGPPVPIIQEAGWAPGPVWTQRLEEKSFAPAGDRTGLPVVQPVVRHYRLLPELTRLLSVTGACYSYCCDGSLRNCAANGPFVQPPDDT
jgi:hypothetical protein